MIRFIFKNSRRDCVSGWEGSQLFTIDIEVPEIERALTAGGYGESGYDRTELIGVEILPEKKENHE